MATAENSSRVVRHAPDAGGYHMPDAEQLRKISAGRVGAFAVIPAARKNGASYGFDPTVAGPVHVDPDEKDGGVIFDPSTLNPHAIQAVLNQNDDPYSVFKTLGVPAKSWEATRGRQSQSTTLATETPTYGLSVDHGPNPYMPNSYVTPSARYSEVPKFMNDREVYSVNPVPPLSTLPPLMAQPQTQQPQQPQQLPQLQQPQPQQFQQPQQQPTYYAPPSPYQPPPMDANMMGMMQALLGMQQQIASLVKSQEAPKPLPPTNGVSSAPLPPRQALATRPAEMSRTKAKRIRRSPNDDDDSEEENEPQQTFQAYTDSMAPAPEAVIAGFETLGLRFVTGPLAHKAKKVVVFNIPNGGKHMSRFHEVVVNNDCIVLVYDTRYEDGNQYIPPTLGPDTPITLSVSEGGKSKDFKVASLGLQYTLGVFDHIVLVRDSSEQLDYTEE